MALTKKQIQAVSLMFDGNLTDKRIAQELKVTPQTIVNWKKKPEFQKMMVDYGYQFMADYAPLLFKNLMNLSLKSKSDFVKLQATQNVLGMVMDKQKEQMSQYEKQVVIINDIPEEKQ